MEYLNGLEIRDKKNKKWGTGKILVQGDTLRAYFPIKPGFKYVDYGYPLDFAKRAKVLTEDEEVLQKIKADIRLAKVDKRSIAFKYNCCDGGSSATIVGFNGVCSDDCIKINVNQAEREWCSGPNSPCRAFIEGKINRAELENEYRKNKFFCYESRFATNWKAGIGVNTDGTPRHLGYDVRNGLAIMTTTDSPRNEENRYIFAVFFILSQEFGDEKVESSVCAFDGNKKAYTLLLSKQEAQQMKFWNYYANPKSPDVLKWGSGLYRFVSHARSARILQDIVSIKTDPDEKQKAKDLLEMFCTTHGITEIPPMDGYLTNHP